MSTVTAPAAALASPPTGRPPSNGAPDNREHVRKPIWDIPIEVIGVSGEFASGKSLFLLTIDPKRTLVYDFEGSTTTYRALGFEFVDAARELLARHPKGYKPKDVWAWWIADVKKRAIPGKYSVIAVDPISELENGLAEYVRDNCGQFGLTSKQIERSAGLFWGALKDEWKLHLNDLRVRCETFGYTAHMRNEYRGNAPTGKREPKGKETLMELSSLYLLMDRSADKKGNVPAVPSATLLKNRLVVFDDQLRPIPALPPRLPEATPDAIRQYIASPPDYHKLKADERVKEHEMSEEEKLRLQVEIAKSNSEAEQASLSRLELMRRAAEEQRVAAAQPGPAPSSDQSHNLAAAKREQAIERAVQDQREHEAKSPFVTEATTEAILERLEGAFDDPSQFREVLQAIGADRDPPIRISVVRELTKAEGDDLLVWLDSRIAARQAEAQQASGQSNDKTEEPPFDASTSEERKQPPVAGDGVDSDWYGELKRLVERSGWSLEGPGSQAEYLKQFGFSAWRSVSHDQAVVVIQHLKERELGAREENDYPN